MIETAIAFIGLILGVIAGASCLVAGLGTCVASFEAGPSMVLLILGITLISMGMYIFQLLGII